MKIISVTKELELFVSSLLLLITVIFGFIKKLELCSSGQIIFSRELVSHPGSRDTTKVQGLICSVGRFEGICMTFDVPDKLCV